VPRGALKNILEVAPEPLVSTDFNGSPYSAAAEALLTTVMDGSLAKVMAWWGNDMGFSHRLLDLAVYLGSR
jgi:glyceraldehyde 3-phosphate dehydrogenase